MAKAFTIIGMVFSLILLLIFGLDLGLGVPFEGANTTMDIGFVVSALILGYLSFNAFREQP